MCVCVCVIHYSLWFISTGVERQHAVLYKFVEWNTSLNCDNQQTKSDHRLWHTLYFPCWSVRTHLGLYLCSCMQCVFRCVFWSLFLRMCVASLLRDHFPSPLSELTHWVCLQCELWEVKKDVHVICHAIITACAFRVNDVTHTHTHRFFTLLPSTGSRWSLVKFRRVHIPGRVWLCPSVKLKGSFSSCFTTFEIYVMAVCLQDLSKTTQISMTFDGECQRGTD